ncbi:Acyl transferase domain-containing protein [Singulisphaera sp. GP187]|nr:Acyl transferase domain-containing protein [Singulisphaera sp. GP187]
MPTARLVAIAADREKVERVANEVGPGTCIAIDNCPHQVVLAGAPEIVERVVVRLRGLGLICEDLPFDRAYHTAAFSTAIEPVRAFFKDLPLSRPKVDVYSCAVARRLSGDVEQIRQVAVDQWALPVAFRATIEAMYRDGIRTFVEVGARGNLTGFVDDILRDRPHFAVAANLPRRSGLTQLNHLVASLYAQGVPLRTNRLYERRQPVWVDLDRDLPVTPPLPALAVGFPELRLSPGLVTQLRDRASAAASATTGAEPAKHEPLLLTQPYTNGHAKTFQESNGAGDPLPSTLHDAMILEHLRTMDAFLETQRQVMGAYITPRGPEQAEADVAGPSPDPRPEPSAPGAWLGTIERLEPGRELVSLRWLDVQGDPVAEHHTLGGRHISALDPTRNGLPVVPFTVMAEMLAQAAGVLVPEAVVIALRDVLALKWIRYEAEPVLLELRAWRDLATPNEVRVVITNKGTVTTQRTGAEEKVVEGRVVFGDARPQGPTAPPLALESARECRFKAEDIYVDQWLFHGPAMQAIVGLGRSAPWGIEGTLRVLPLRGLLRDSEPPAFRTDPIVLDAFTQLLGCWGMDQLDEGHVIFPLRVSEIAFFGTDPPEGAEVSCQIAIREQSRHLVRVDADIAAANGRVWMRINGWEDWRFYWPVRCRDHFRQPNRWFIGEPLSLPGLSLEAGRATQAVWLEPPIDFGRPIWRDVLEWVQFGSEEREASLDERRSDLEATLNLWGRVAAKEATQRLLLDRGEPPVYPADLTIETDPHGGHSIRFLGDPARIDRPVVAMAQTEGVAVALAVLDPESRPGIAIQALEESASDAESPALDRITNEDVRQSEWKARLVCAKNALRNSLGLSRAETWCDFDVSRVDESSGEVFLTLRSNTTTTNRAQWQPPAIRVVTARTKDYVWAWTVGDRPS